MYILNETTTDKLWHIYAYMYIYNQFGKEKDMRECIREKEIVKLNKLWLVHFYDLRMVDLQGLLEIFWFWKCYFGLKCYFITHSFQKVKFKQITTSKINYSIVSPPLISIIRAFVMTRNRQVGPRGNQAHRYDLGIWFL